MYFYRHNLTHIFTYYALLIYSALYNSKGQVGLFKVGNINFSLKSLTENSSIVSDLEELPPADGGEKTCPQQYPKDFGKCMTCAINECANSFPCNITCTIMARECLIGFALACAL